MNVACPSAIEVNLEGIGIIQTKSQQNDNAWIMCIIVGSTVCHLSVNSIWIMMGDMDGQLNGTGPV